MNTLSMLEADYSNLIKAYITTPKLMQLSNMCAYQNIKQFTFIPREQL
jgi:hypothetical protein